MFSQLRQATNSSLPAMIGSELQLVWESRYFIGPSRASAAKTAYEKSSSSSAGVSLYDEHYIVTSQCILGKKVDLRLELRQCCSSVFTSGLERDL